MELYRNISVTLLPPNFLQEKSTEIQYKHGCFEVCAEKWLPKTLVMEYVLKRFI